jgi:microcystin-dependent protein
MAEPFLSEIRIMSFGFAPKGWALCDGQLMPINQNQALFSLLGTQFGGNGQTNFALPDLRGRTPIHEGAGHIIGERGGQTAVTLTRDQLPLHTHFAQASSAPGNAFVPTGNLLAKVEGVDVYNPPTDIVPMAPSAIDNAGGNQAHVNLQPLLTLNFCIALQGIFPSRN